MSRAAVPAGYVRFATGPFEVVTRVEHRADALVLHAHTSAHEFAACDPSAHVMQGRAPTYAITLPASRIRAVVRHNRRGGLLAPLARDLFLPPTRAPYELATSLRLAEAGVRTPPVLLYAIETVRPMLRRVDVVTREIPGGRDLATYMRPATPADARAAAWAAARALVMALSRAGARHHDLNVKNILLVPVAGGGLDAWVLDVDRVTFGTTNAEAVRRGNAARLLRSARKWRDELGAAFDERELASLGTVSG